eukprot:4695864-Prymnesium_polylepis.1
MNRARIPTLNFFSQKPSCDAHQPRKVQWWPVRRSGAPRRWSCCGAPCDGHRGRHSPNGEPLGW